MKTQTMCRHARAGHGTQRTCEKRLPYGHAQQEGFFGRMFPQLSALEVEGQQLRELAEGMAQAKTQDHVDLPAGYTYLGQFIDHTITLDTTPLGEFNNDPDRIRNFRTPRLDLDSVYGGGPEVDRHLYDTDEKKLLIGTTNKKPGQGDPSLQPEMPNDLPRTSAGYAIIGDLRNDENLIVAQTHLAFLKLHNKVVDDNKDYSFEQARIEVLHNFQWVVLNDFLPRMIQPCVLQDVLENGRKFYNYECGRWAEPFMPVEFSGAAYRFGHSLVRDNYDFNRVFKEGGFASATLERLFNFTRLSGDKKDFENRIPIPSDWIIDWRRFYQLSDEVKPNLAKAFDGSIAITLKDVPNVGKIGSLPARNLLRGHQLGLPSGQAVARLIGAPVVKPADLSRGTDGQAAKDAGLVQESPLWFYILKEAEVTQEGRCLGPVGSRIVAEVFVGLLQADHESYLVRNPKFEPTFPQKGTKFEMADILRFVDDINPIG